MLRVAAAVIALSLVASMAYAQMFGQFMVGGPALTGAVLLESGGSNFLLLENGSHLCLEAGSSC